MIGTIRKHSKLLWLVIIVVIIFTFVIWGSNTGQQGSGQDVDYGSILGKKVSADDFNAAVREIKIRHFMNRRQWPENNTELQQEAYYRLLFIQKQEDLGIYPDPDAVATFAANRIRAFNQGNFIALDVFAKQVLATGNVTAEDYERYARHELGLIHLQTLAAISGDFVSNEELRSVYTRENEEYSTQVAFFLTTNYFGSVTQSVAAIGEFYTNNMPNYRLPERMRVTYVAFPASNYLAEVGSEMNQDTNLAEALELNYQVARTNIAYATQTADEIRTNILVMHKNGKAMQKAYAAARDFAGRLFQITPARSELLEAFARSNGLPTHISQPFDKETGPKDLPVGNNAAAFATIAFNLNAEEPYAGPLAGTNAIYVIAPKDKLPSEQPPFESVRAKVVDDYKASQASAIARKAGADFQKTLTNTLAVGKTFIQACTEANVRPIVPPTFSLATEAITNVAALADPSVLNAFKQVTYMTPPGQASPFIPTREGGFVLFVAAKLPVDETKLRAALPSVTRTVRESRQNEAFNYWFYQERSRALQEVPLFQQPRQPAGAPPTQ